ncbi:hypothetical protein [Streptomyces pinistramenti]|uniref:hypothetical protein n=1 Tax=Streptomyces pinistramenti TaxID=2884812 RepID=UPI001D08094C|nr:hypothetical protein [Streptomyces pinistramenti]MCB5912189.1 hypothetical protein [Streptomyces pinistramenti]
MTAFVTSVALRPSGQNLIATGTYIEMTTRILETTLLGFGVPAIRSRIKRWSPHRFHLLRLHSL